MTDPAVPLEFKTGLGYSPNSGPPFGGWSYMPVSSFFGDPVYTLLPSGRTYFGKKRRRKVGKQRGRFGNRYYPLSDQPSETIDMKMFPDPPVGPGDTPGGNGGELLQGMPSFNQYWGFGKRSRKRKSNKKRKSSRRGKNKRRRSGNKRRACKRKRKFSKRRRSGKRS